MKILAKFLLWSQLYSRFWDFVMEDGDELLNSETSLHCDDVIYLDQGIEWILMKLKRSPNICTAAVKSSCKYEKRIKRLDLYI